MEWLLGILAVVVVFLVASNIMKHGERNKYIQTCTELKGANEKLEGEIKLLKKKLSEPAPKSETKTKKKNKDEDAVSSKSADVDALNEKIRSLKADNAKLKEKNYSLTKDNESLRKDIKTNSASNEEDQREIVSMREQNADLNLALNEAKAKISTLEKQLVESQNETVVKPQKSESHVTEHTEEDTKKMASLERENASLQASLKDVRGELAALKRDFRSEVDAAKKEVAEFGKSVKKELNAANRQAAQFKKRADNNHKIYLIARAQMLLAEKRLMKYEANYKPVMALATSNEAIDEIVKKFHTLEARGNRTSMDVYHKDKAISELQEKIQQLEAENTQLKASKPTVHSDAFSFSGLEDGMEFEDESLSNLVNSLGSNMKPIESDTDEAASSLTSLDANTLVDLDFGNIDDEWNL